MAMTGECVLGSTAADVAGVGLDGHVYSAPETVFDLAGVYPLKMKVVGVLKPAGTPDDLVVFVDVKTAWIIEGLRPPGPTTRGLRPTSSALAPDT